MTNSKDTPSKGLEPPKGTDDIWSVVTKSRHPQRPHALDYIKELFSSYEELKGDRIFKNDAALIGGTISTEVPSLIRSVTAAR